MNDLTYPIDHELAAKGYKRLGWNFLGPKASNQDPIRTECFLLEHKLKDVSNTNRGTDCTIYCDVCQYFYKLDRGD